MESGNLAKWNMKEGARITAGDIICEIETDKAVRAAWLKNRFFAACSVLRVSLLNLSLGHVSIQSQVVDYEATDDMWLAKILVAEGTENIGVGQPMMVTCEEEEYLAGLADYKVEVSADVAAPAAKSPEEIPPKKDEVAVDAASKAPVVPGDFLVTSQTTQKAVAGPAIPEPVKRAAPAPAAAAAKPAPPASAVVFAEKWGQGIKKSAISLSLLKKQQHYIDVYGLTGTSPVSK